MIVTPQDAERIKSGRKTQHWVPVIEPRLVQPKIRTASGARIPHGPERLTRPFEPQIGARLSVRVPQLTSPEAAGRRQQTSVEECVVLIRAFDKTTPSALLDGLDHQRVTVVRAHGLRTTNDLKAAWVRRHDGRWVISRETSDADGRPAQLTDEQLADRFDQRWAHRPIWALTIEVDHDPTRYPATAGHGDERGYTTNPGEAIQDVGIGVDDTTLQAFAREAHERDLARRAGVDDTLIGRLADHRRARHELQHAAAARGLDVRSALRLMDRGQAMIERQIKDQLNSRRSAA